MSAAVAEAVTPPETTPGAMERRLTREVPGGLIEFEEAPVGWLKKDGEKRRAAWRAYFWTPTGGERVRFPSVSTLEEAICPKGGLAVWAEERGIEGLLAAIQAGTVDPSMLDARAAIEAVRRLKLGADAAKKTAADRGLNIHAINEHYRLTGEPPKLADHPPDHRGFIKSWIRATLALKPEPVEVEQLIVHPEHGYAGRLDERAYIGRLLETVDYKTQEKGAIYTGAHYKVCFYERGAVWCGAEPATHCRVIALPADGDWNIEQHTMIADHPEQTVLDALAFYRSKRPIDSACEARNRGLKEAQAEAESCPMGGAR